MSSLDAVPPAVGRKRDRQATEKILLIAAAAVFVERGYEGATTKAIAARAGCSEALIQNYFGGKESLLLAVVQREGGGEPELSLFFERALCPSLEIEAKETLTFTAAVLARRSAALRIVFGRVFVDPDFRSLFNRITVRNHVKTSLTERLKRYAQAGLIRSGVKADSAAEMLMTLGFQLGFVHADILRTETAEVVQLVTDFSVLFARAVASAPSRKTIRPKD